MLWGMIDERKGRDMLRQKIGRMIVCRENKAPDTQKAAEQIERAQLARKEFEDFEDLMRKNGYEKRT